ncbi:hypothetical protein P7K49_021713 [Saguinus oedipus]|uniref:Uncharacterized protein n=1 Tax=Saguinus oedipus TaxID=9490 RepID=A0ABQ9UU98_SAGOE|nr:hypothetical protein P7K49_021713 [Saguinus oedipus]
MTEAVSPSSPVRKHRHLPFPFIRVGGPRIPPVAVPSSHLHHIVPRPFLTVTPQTLAMLRTPILQAPSAITPDHVKPKARTIPTPKQRQHFLTPMPAAPPCQHKRATQPRTSPSAESITYLCRQLHRLTPGRPPPHEGGGESSDTGARKTTLLVPDPRCPRSPHTCHGRAWQLQLRPLTLRAGHRAPWTLPSPPHRLHRARARGRPAAPEAPLTSRPPQGSARRRDRHLHPGLPKAPIH